MPLNIAVIGNDFNSSHPVFTCIAPALEEAAASLDIRCSRREFSTNELSKSMDKLKLYDGIFVAPSPFRDLERLYDCARFARETRKPWLAVCGGAQYALVEFGRNALDLPGCGHVEHNPDCPVKFVNLLPDRYRVPNDGPLKLFPIGIRPGTRAASIYAKAGADEMFFANYMLDPAYYDRVQAAGLLISGTFDDDITPCLVEIKDHPFFMGALFQPQMRSTLNAPHPLIRAFLEAARQYGEQVG